eukprot:6175376-Pleurochrysis_carterae.AAC.8
MSAEMKRGESDCISGEAEMHCENLSSRMRPRTDAGSASTLARTVCSASRRYSRVATTMSSEICSSRSSRSNCRIILRCCATSVSSRAASAEMPPTMLASCAILSELRDFGCGAPRVMLPKGGDTMKRQEREGG